MDTEQTKTLCLKYAYESALTEAEQALVDDYIQTDDGKNYLQECREMKDLLNKVADVQIKPVDHQAMVESFEKTVRQSFKKTVFRPWWEANSPPMILGLMAGLFIVLDGWSVINSVLLGSCVLWLITDNFQRYYMAKILSRPDLYEYARASRRRSERMLQSVRGKALVAVFAGLAIAAVSYAAYWGYREYGIIVPVIATFVLVQTVAIVVYQFRNHKSSAPEVWDWWAEDIKE